MTEDADAKSDISSMNKKSIMEILKGQSELMKAIV